MSQITGRTPVKGWFGRVVDGDVESVFRFQFNPPTVTREHDVGYAMISSPGSALPTAQFQAITGDTISLTLLLDATERYSDLTEGVGDQRAELEAFTLPNINKFISEVGQFVVPPQVVFGFGNDFFEVIIPKITFRDVRFNSKLYVTRSYADIRMTTYFTTAAALATRLQRIEVLRSSAIVRAL